MKHPKIAIASIAAALFATSVQVAFGQETILYNFGANPSPATPTSTLVSDGKGNLYGTTQASVSPSGFNQWGTVFELSPVAGGGWTETTLTIFGADDDGLVPNGVIFDAKKENLFGTVSGGGANSRGAVIEISPSGTGTWAANILYSFTATGTDGNSPDANLVFDAKGNLYGTTDAGGTDGLGTIFELSPAAGGTWNETILYSFTGNGDGVEPRSSLVFDKAGNLYGTTYEGGQGPGQGTVFEASPAGAGQPWIEQPLHTFAVEDTPDLGGNLSGLIADADGNFYGVADSGGPHGGGGVYELSPAAGGGWNYQVLYSFNDQSGSGDGNNPEGGVIFDAKGDLWGTTFHGGTDNPYGAIYELIPTGGGSWGETVVYSFTGPTDKDGFYPEAGLTIDASGNLYGITTQGGTYTYGTVFKFKPSPLADTPTFTPEGDTYDAAQSVEIKDPTSGAVIYYTLDGTTPTAASTKYTGAIKVTSAVTISAIAVATGHANSLVAVANYAISTQAATPEFSIAAGTYGDPQLVAITDSSPGATIYYTTDGSTPTSTSTKYAGAIAVSATETIQAYAVAKGFTDSSTASATYTIYSYSGNARMDILYSFTGEGSCPGFGLPSAPIFDAKGVLYGTCNGVTGQGEIYKLTPTVSGGWDELVIYELQDLGNPNPGLIFDAKKVNLYGTEGTGGTYGAGTVYELSPAAGDSWTLNTLYTFQDGVNDGQAPGAGMIFDAAGNLYGTTEIGGANGDGTVFKLTPGSGGKWTETILYSFGATTTDGVNPKSSLIFDSKGNLYGSTYGGGGQFSFGTVFELSPASGGKWTEKVIGNFNVSGQPYGQHPVGTLVFDSKGNLYGVTNSSGGVFELSPASGGTWTIKVVHAFGSNPLDGSSPSAGLVMDPKGNIWGTTSSGGSNGYAGTIFELVPSGSDWTEDVAYTFNQTDYIGYTPATTLTLDAKGNLYGLTTQGGINGGGTAFEFYATPTAATPTFSPAAGVFDTAQKVAIADATPGATIYYTTNGKAPTKSSTKYIAPITVSATETIEAIAVASGYAQSAVATAKYSIEKPAATPVFTPAGGSYTTVQSVKITDSTPGAIIYYTTNGSAPTTSSTKYTAAITVSTSETIKAIAVASGFFESAEAKATYTLPKTGVPPVFSPAAGPYTTKQTVKITDSVAGANIYYTTNGTTPTASSTKYTAPIVVAKTETIKAIATAKGYFPSAAASATYTIGATAAKPVFAPAAGTYDLTKSVTITDATKGAVIRYTTNGSTPTATSTEYTKPISVVKTTTIKAIAIATGYFNSTVVSATYTITPPADKPTFSPAAGTYTAVQTVTIKDGSAGASIYYTTDGTTPTTKSAKYAKPISVAATETIKAIAVAPGDSSSAIATALYTIELPAATPAFSLKAGTYTGTQMVTITDATAGATIYYTTNGDTPVTASTKYTGPIAVSSSETIKAIAKGPETLKSAVASAAYTIK